MRNMHHRLNQSMVNGYTLIRYVNDHCNSDFYHEDSDFRFIFKNQENRQSAQLQTIKKRPVIYTYVIFLIIRHTVLYPELRI